VSIELAGRRHYGLTFAVLAGAGISYALLQSLVAPALPVIQRLTSSSVCPSGTCSRAAEFMQ